MSDSIDPAIPAAAKTKKLGKPLPPPFPVSPVIKFFRWTFLIVGVYHGASKRKRLAAKEIIIREEERKKKMIRDAEVAEHRRQASDRDIATIAKLFK